MSLEEMETICAVPEGVRCVSFCGVEVCVVGGVEEGGSDEEEE